MCNRYSLTEEEALKAALLKFYGMRLETGRTPHRRYNIAPREKGGAAVIRSDAEGRPDLAYLRWGYVPMFDDAGKYDATNARAKTAFESGAWRGSIQTRRCAVPADGFYEFTKHGKVTQAYRVTLKRGGVFFMPGVYVSAHGKWPEGFAFFTVEPCQAIAKYHDRQPVILADDQVTAWLKPGPLTTAEFASFMRQVPSDEFVVTPVARYVNKVGNEGPQCLEEVPAPAEPVVDSAPKPVQEELFSAI